MGAEKKNLKGGGYVGGFLHLFDWNGKSRKKLFSNKSDLPEQLKQGKKGDMNLPLTRFHLVDEDEVGAGSSTKGGSDYSCASSVTDEDGCGIRAPGVVARLMGLDTLPTSNSEEPHCTPIFDCQSIRDSQYHRKNVDVHDNHHLMSSGNFPTKVEGAARITTQPKLQKMSNRPIEKFQSEILPPKSAKSIPVTHNKILSPIKGPGFIPTKNAAHIMEAAAKIIEQGPKTTSRAKIAPVSPSVPLKVRELKEKLEAPVRASRLSDSSRRLLESSAAKHLKGQPLNKSWNGSTEASFSVYDEAGENSATTMNKGKSVSLAIQAKVNVQRREGLNPSSSRSLGSHRERDELKSSQSLNSQPNVQKSIQKRSTLNACVLKQNNQKQNSLDKEKLSPNPRSFGSNLQGKKTVSLESSVGRQKISGKSAGNIKGGSRKSGLEMTDSLKGAPYSKSKNSARKKRYINEDFDYKKNQNFDNMLTNGDERPVKLNPLTDRQFNWAEESKTKGMDVVSFTFTAPMARSASVSESSNLVAERNNGHLPDCQGKRKLVDSDSTKLSTLGFNVIGGDALSVLLEQKLKELSCKIESSRCNSAKVETEPSSDKVSSVQTVRDDRGHYKLHVGKFGSHFESQFFSTEPLERRIKHKFQGVEEMDDYCGAPAEAGQLLDCRHPSPVSTLEAFPTESCNSSDSLDSYTTEGSRQSSSVQAQELIGLGSSKKLHLIETETELSDSASSTAFGALARKNAVTMSVQAYSKTAEWELDYVNEILCNVDLMFQDFALGRARKILNPYLFDQLESRKGGLSNEDGSRIRRQVLFDCVSECLELKCARHAGGGCKLWAKGMMMVRRNQRLAEEVYKEICGWRGMGNCMVDELVEKDMSSQYGRWLDFEVDAFALGADIENEILNSLMDEVFLHILL